MTASNNTFLVDTGADISIFKRTKIRYNQLVDISNRSKIRGVTDGISESLGTTKTVIFIDGYRVEHQFHVVNADFPIPVDGILGRDFIKKYRCNLDYSNFTMTIRLGPYNIFVPIHNGPEEDVLIIPPRCEVIRRVNNLKSLKHDALVINQELQTGIFVGRTIVSKDKPFVNIINTTFETVTLKKFKPTTVPLEEFIIYSLGQTAPKTQSTNSVMKEIVNNTPEFVKEKMLDLCNEFSDIFASKSEKLSVNNFYKQKLRLMDDKPVYVKNYRTPIAQRNEIERQVKEMLDKEIIEPSMSEYNSPVLLVPKKSTDGQKAFRLVVDFRLLNKKLVQDKFPLPRIDDILDQLGRAKWFSVLDLMSGFHQIPLSEESRDITSFSVNSGSFKFTRLPFGLSVSPNSFQRMMSLAFAGITPERAFLYMDDLIVVGCSDQHHLNNLRKVFETCRKHNLKLNPLKCQFFRKEVTYLGHKITDKGILPDDSKFDVIKKYPVPKTAEEVKRFVAFCNYYRRFIPQFAETTNALNKLTRKNTPFIWTAECQKSFDTLKNSLISPQLLQYPDFSKTFYLTTDASQIACGAILSQMFNGQELPIAYASRTFSKSEMNKPTILKELLAIHWAIKYFRCYLYGQKFIVKTDHRPLVYLFSMKDPSSKLTRVRLELEEYDFEIQYIRGKDNVGADALSRINTSDLKQIYENTSQIFAITRSKSKLQSPEQVQTPKVQPTPQPKVHESLNNANELKLPLLQFSYKPSSLRMMIRQKKN